MQARLIFPLTAVVLSVLGGCATHSSMARIKPGNALGQAPSGLQFSAYAPSGARLPSELKHMVLPNNAPTEYQLEQQDNQTVLHAKVDGSASGVRKVVDADPNALPWLVWHWKTSALLTQADNTQSDKEDAPARIILNFSGDRSTLSFREQTLNLLVRLVTGEDMPYASLVYIWENHLPVGTIIDSAHSSRVKMVVAASGPTQVGQWVTLPRNVVEDYRRAFGEAPGRLTSIGVMSDANCTAGRTEAWYGDIELSAYGDQDVLAAVVH
ncbi:MAG: DUF3047 domain-containing protein [Burkholderiaceae bacterium]|nr:MAG: DUF3047 domain-containing protein [Burkholderiaceae bacterium]